MKAWNLHTIGDIRYEDVKAPVPQDNEVLIKVMAAGICGSDIPRIYNTGAHKMPLIPGHEFAGIVEEVGDSAFSNLKGKRVSVFPKIPCGKCPQCLSGRKNLCTSYDYVGSRRDGAFAEYVTVPRENLFILPESVDYKVGAMAEPMAVAVNTVRKVMGLCAGKNYEEQKIAICGMGTIGLMVLMFLMDAGFKDIYVIGNKKIQRELAVKLGLSEERFCDSTKEEPRSALITRAGAVNFYIECVGKEDTILMGLDVTEPCGNIILVGNPYSDVLMKRDIYWKILRNQLTLTGIWNSVFDGSNSDDWHYLFNRLESGNFYPEQLITHELPLDKLDKGLAVMRDKTEEYCKIMINGKP